MPSRASFEGWEFENKKRTPKPQTLNYYTTQLRVWGLVFPFKKCDLGFGVWGLGFVFLIFHHSCFVFRRLEFGGEGSAIRVEGSVFRVGGVAPR